MNITTTEAPRATVAAARAAAAENGPILLAVSASTECAAAAGAAGSLAESLGVELHVVHGWQPMNLTFGYGGEPAIDYGAYGQPAAEVLRRQVDELRRLGIKVAGEHLVMGLAPDEVSHLASRLGAQLIVTGGRGLGLVKRLLLGSVSQGVVRAAHVPVLVVPDHGESWPPDRVVVGFDGSKAATSAAAAGGLIARATGAQLILATVVTPAELRDTMPGVAAAAAGDRMEVLAARLREEIGISVQTAVLAGAPAHALLSMASGSPPAMLALGSRGDGTIRRLALGSQSMTALQGAHGAVLISHATSSPGSLRTSSVRAQPQQ